MDVRLTTLFLAGRLRMPSPRISIPTKGDRPPFGCVLISWTQLSEQPHGSERGT